MSNFKCPVCGKEVKTKNSGIAYVDGAAVSVGMNCQSKIRSAKDIGIQGVDKKLYKAI